MGPSQTNHRRTNFTGSETRSLLLWWPVGSRRCERDLRKESDSNRHSPLAYYRRRSRSIISRFSNLTVRMWVRASHDVSFVLEDLHPLVLLTQHVYPVAPAVNHSPHLSMTHSRHSQICSGVETHHLTKHNTITTYLLTLIWKFLKQPHGRQKTR